MVNLDLTIPTKPSDDLFSPWMAQTKTLICIMNPYKNLVKATSHRFA